MLLDLHVKNLALIERADIEFGDGLNILTGETGAGKSIIIGSVNIALGGKVPRDIIRTGADYAYIELVFSVTDPAKAELLKEMDVFPDGDGMVIISKKIMPSRSVSKINDETVTAAKLRSITSLLIDIHGQHEHQSLLYKSKHLEILDAYAKSQTQSLKQNIADLYHEYMAVKERLESLSMDQESRLREADFCRFEIDEIENAGLKEGEEEELSREYRRFMNAQKIAAGLSAAYDAVGGDGIGRALKEVNLIADYDEKLQNIRSQLYDVDSIISDVTRDIADYMDDMSFDEEEYYRIEKRLDLIHNLQAKYGDTVEKILASMEEKKKKLDELENHDLICRQLEKELSETEHKLDGFSQELSEIRKKASVALTKKIKESLADLNFIDVEFTMTFKRLDHYTPCGFDEAEFMISTNPGETPKPLGAVASGGELSRIMLAVKTVLADSDEIPTLIFDEIDTGISGRTAQKVSEKLSYISKTHQVICITHLPQIAAMADTHFEIAKHVVDKKTVTTIRPLEETEMVNELARLLGGAQITDTVYQNAKEMKILAGTTKL